MALVDTLPPLPNPHEKKQTPPIDLVTIARFNYSAEAHLAAARLESEGIPAFVADEHTIIANWMYSGAIGGIKVWVRKPDAEAARELLNYTIKPENDVTASEKCPVCQAPDIHYETFASKPIYLIWLLTYLLTAYGFTLPFLKRKWVCRSCGHRWKEKKTRENKES